MNYEPFTSIENLTLAHFRHFRHFSSLFTKFLSTSVESSLQIDLFMQNKPNFRKSQMNVSSILTRAYENISDWTIGQSKPNSNPIKPNLQNAQMNINLTLTKDYRKNDDFAVQKNKPNFVKGTKWTQTLFYKRIMKMNHPQAPKKQTQNKPNFFKGQNRLLENLTCSLKIARTLDLRYNNV